MGKIHLIGTIHNDFKGRKRLEKALEEEKPDIITLEASQSSLDYCLNTYDDDLKMSLKALKDMGISDSAYSFFEGYLNLMASERIFEYQVCKNYSEKNGIPLYLVGDDDNNNLINLKKDMLSQITSLDPKLLDEISYENITEGHDYLYSTVQGLYDGKIPTSVGEEHLINPLRGAIIGKTDETGAKNIEELLSKYDTAKIVHVGGGAHMLSDSSKETLYSRLENFNPSRRTLMSYD